jgi:demethoxyubiquinone hydroxylase (CLK1/Coq7/Cat5 family)
MNGWGAVSGLLVVATICFFVGMLVSVVLTVHFAKRLDELERENRQLRDRLLEFSAREFIRWTPASPAKLPSQKRPRLRVLKGAKE